MIPKRLSTYNVCRRLFCVAKLIAMAVTAEKVAKRHFFEFLRVSPLAFSPGRQNPQSTKTSGFSSVLTHMSSERIEHKGLIDRLQPRLFHAFNQMLSVVFMQTMLNPKSLAAGITVTT